MMRNTAFISGVETSDGRSNAHAAMGNIVQLVRSFRALMQKAMVRARSRRQLARLDGRMLQDTGLEPFDVYYGWRGSPRARPRFLRFLPNGE
ncbi:DUF1127 domain-containing protein [Microvirga pakistanensis]|uniref:DUF1127 domain-containing protein n=1 Tax=Microvirga pakistanensis TaxID=1682650 RepID=UPI00106B4B93|nr:DUF1127 domain-containing protein [Microvirga pakistanensis]